MTKPPESNEMPTFSEADGEKRSSKDHSTFDPEHIAMGDFIDDYKILNEIGQGGMGIVFKAYEKSLRRIVALKVLHSNIAQNPSIAKRFRREAVLAANLSHANIVPVFHIDESPNPKYFTMEFVQGKSIKEKIEKEGFFEPSEAIRILLQACSDLQYAHENNIIHRDIKPSNILLQNHLERVRITDFGIAQDIAGQIDDSTQTEEATAGTPGFMSPEQNLGENLDKRTDIFSLGLTFHYMLTGQMVYWFNVNWTFSCYG